MIRHFTLRHCATQSTLISLRVHVRRFFLHVYAVDPSWKMYSTNAATNEEEDSSLSRSKFS